MRKTIDAAVDASQEELRVGETVEVKGALSQVSYLGPSASGRGKLHHNPENNEINWGSNLSGETIMVGIKGSYSWLFKFSFPRTDEYQILMEVIKEFYGSQGKQIKLRGKPYLTLDSNPPTYYCEAWRAELPESVIFFSWKKTPRIIYKQQHNQ